VLERVVTTPNKSRFFKKMTKFQCETQQSRVVDQQRVWSEILTVTQLASGQYRGGFTRAAYGGAEVDQGLLYGFG
jgi:hypothetical protein